MLHAGKVRVHEPRCGWMTWPVMALTLALASCAVGPGEESPVQLAAGSAAPARSGGEGPEQLFESSFIQGFEHAAAPAAPPARAKTSCGFRRSLLAEQRNVMEFIASRRSQGRSAAEITTFLTSGDALADVHRRMERIGMDPSDVSDTLATLHASVWQVVNDTSVSPEDMAAFRATVGDICVLDRRMHAADDLYRQKAADSYALMIAVLGHDASKVRDLESEADTQQFREAIRSGWKQQSGMDMRRMKISSDGLVLR